MKHIRIFLASLCLLQIISIKATAENLTLNVCLYENPPLVFTDASGKASGLFVELLDAVAAREGWNTKYLSSSWAECLSALQQGRVDLLPAIAYTEERARTLSFNEETIITNWGVVYAQEESSLSGFWDLRGKTIAVLENDIYTEVLKDLLRKFQIPCTLIHVPSYDAVLASVAKKTTDAGVVNRLYGQQHASRYRVQSTPIVFHPLEIRFAGKNGLDRKILEAIDRHVRKWKQNRQSIYHRGISRWLQIPAAEIASRSPHPDLLWGMVAALCILGILTLALKRRASLFGRQLQSTHQDIDQILQEKKETAEALVETEMRYRALFDKASEALFVLDETGHFVECNEAACQMFLTSREWIIGKTPLEISPPEQPDGSSSKKKAFELMHTTLQGKPQRFEWLHQKCDGTLFPAEVQLTLFYEEKKPHLMASVRDITPHKIVTQTMEAQRRQLEMILDTTPVGIFLVDPEGRITLWNRTSELLTKVQKHQVLGRKPRFESLHGGKEPLIPALLLLRFTPEEIIKRFSDRKLQIYPFHPESIQTIGEIQVNGDTRYLSIIAARLRDDRGTLIGAIQCARDITQEVLLQRQLFHSQKMEAIGRLAGGVAHDLNNILTVILGYSDLLLMSHQLNDKEKKRIADIRKIASRASDLTQHLLAFSRKQVMQLKTVDLNESIDRMEKMLRRLIGEDISLEVHLYPDLWPIKADPVHIEQIILNLAVNARDAMPTGGRLSIETSNVIITHLRDYGSFSIPPGEYVVLQMSDTGHGMDENIKEKIFEPFFTTKPMGVGTGLGLSTVYGIVKQLEGYILVDSSVGQGTSFILYFPRTHEKKTHPLPKKTRWSEHSDLQGTESILVVEDEQEVRHAAKEALTLYGYHVVTAASGKEAIEICTKEASFDLLLVDVIMPDMDGKKTAEEILRIIPNIAVLYMSGYTDDRLAPHGLVDSEIEFISKPFTPRELARKVRKVLDAHRLPSASLASDEEPHPVR